MIQKSIIVGFSWKRIGRRNFLVIHKRTLITSSNNDNNDDESSDSDSSMDDSSSVSSNHDFDPSNGRRLDRSQEVADRFQGDRVGLNNYFMEKEDSITSALEADMVASRGTEFDTAQHSQELVRIAHSLLTELEGSKDTIRDLANIPVTEPSSPSYFPQDSSDVERTDHMSSFDEDDC